MKKERQKPEISQLHRIQGQLRGVEKLINEKVEVNKIIQQIEAMRGNLKTLEKRILGQKIKNLKDSELKKIFNYLLKLN